MDASKYEPVMETISDAKLNIVIKYNVKASDFMSLGRVFLPCVRDFLSHERDFQSEASGYVGVASGHMSVTSGNECVTAGHVGLSPKQFFTANFLRPRYFLSNDFQPRGNDVLSHGCDVPCVSCHVVATSCHVTMTSCHVGDFLACGSDVSFLQAMRLPDT